MGFRMVLIWSDLEHYWLSYGPLYVNCVFLSRDFFKKWAKTGFFDSGCGGGVDSGWVAVLEGAEFDGLSNEPNLESFGALLMELWLFLVTIDSGSGSGFLFSYSQIVTLSFPSKKSAFSLSKSANLLSKYA
jgi:hypothetical protein